jgi:hypothetical protein
MEILNLKNMNKINESLFFNKPYSLKTNYLRWWAGTIHRIIYDNTCIFWTNNHSIATQMKNALNGAYLMGIKDALISHKLLD